MDIRTGKSLYQLPSTCTVSTLASFEALDMEGGREVKLGSISSDCTLRVYSTAGIPEEGGKWKGEGKKGRVEGMVGGIGVGEFCFLGHGEMDISIEGNKGDEKVNGEEAEDEEEEAEDVWDEMVEIGDAEEMSGSDQENDGQDEEWD